MDIRVKFKRSKRRRIWIAEVWSSDPDPMASLAGFDEPYPEPYYVELNDWCINNLGYHARTAYNIFEFKKQKELTMFLLKWS